ncbi:villin [Cavenderia fasciculata]|uniref:Villin n=1 Tax=Cavenderia fasciculata TaxID=261658 RepID=F4PYR8_CACFS|nr:villin [Cavenderia fasciculata]EGG19334.1 villin [Cavenderia fasciculata]|eukprot:XP_004357605.1 villin [Cavenderia fasciculata]
MDDSEARKKRLEELKQQSLDMEKEAQEREKRAEERKRAREEQLKILQEQEKKDEEERIRKRDERRRLREEEDRKLKEDLEKLESERKNRSQSSTSDGASISSSTSTSATNLTSMAAVDDDDPELKKIREEREKRMEEKRKQREEAQKQIEEQERKLAEERQRRMREREKREVNEPTSPPTEKVDTFKQDQDAAALVKEKEEQERIAKEKSDKEEQDRLAKEKSDKEEQDRLAKEKADKEEQERIAKEKSDKEEQDRLAKEKADKEEQERIAKEKSYCQEKADKEEQDRLEKERIAKEKSDKEEQDRIAKEKSDKEEQDRIAKEKSDKEEQDRLAKEKSDKEEQERIAKEKSDKEEQDRLAKEKSDKEEQDRLAKEKADKEEQDRLEKERIAKEKSDKEEQDRIAKEKSDKEEQDRLEKERVAKEKSDKEEQDRLAKEKADREEQERIAKEKSDKEEQDRLEKERIAKEKSDKEEQDRIAKEKADKEEQDRIAKEKSDKEEQDRLEKERIAKEKSDKEEQDRLEKERIAKEKSDKEEQDRIAKEKAAKEEQDRIAKEKAAKEEQDRLAKEKADKEEQDRLEKERIAKEKSDKEEQDRIAKEKAAKEEQDRIAKEKAAKEDEDRIAKEKAAKDEQDRIAKEKADKEEQDRIAKEKAAKEEQDRLAKEKAAKEEQDRIAKEKADKDEKDRIAKEKADKEERDRIAKEKLAKEEEESKSSKTKVSDSFKLQMEKQLKQQLDQKNNPQPAVVVNEEPTSSSVSSPSKLSSLTMDRARIQGRKLPSKNAGKSIVIDPSKSSASSSSFSSSGPSLLSQALEAKQDDNSKPVTQDELKDRIMKRMVMPPGAGGLLGGMAALAAEAQKKKLENDKNKAASMINVSSSSSPNNRLASIKSSESEINAPNFVKGRSQSVSVSSTMRGDPSKFLVHKKAVDTYSGLRTRLIHCKGKKRILTKEVEVTTKSLNKCDAFVLDCGIENSGVGGESSDSSAHSNIYVWYGSKATANKKSKAVAIAEIIKSHERGGHATVYKIDEGDKDKDALEFFKQIKGAATDSIKEEGGDDVEAETHWASSYTLLKYDQDAKHLVNVEQPEAQKGILSLELLASDSYFVLDTGSEFYAWSGRNADFIHKDSFIEKAKERLASGTHRQSWVDMIITSEGGEPVMFREKFADWPDLSHEVSLSRMGFGKKRLFEVAIPYEKKSPAKMNQFDVTEMVYSELPEEAEDERAISESSFEVWYVEDNKIVELPKQEYGHLYSGNCYIIRYTYSRWNAFRFIIFIWQGIDATRNDIGMSTLLSKDMYIETSNRGDCVQECVRHGREPRIFTQSFNGKFVMHRGVRGDVDLKSTRLYHVHGKKDDRIYAIQCTRVTSSALNSRDAFIVSDSKTTYLWVGRGATKALVEQSQNLAKIVDSGNAIQRVDEGKESDAFWKMLGGKQKYADHEFLVQSVQPPIEKNRIQMFAVVNTGSIIRADEIFNFNQYDFQINRVFILDTKSKIFVWSGSKAPEKEKKRAMEIAIDYLHARKDGRKEEDVLFIKEKEEPLSFTSCYHAWDTFKYSSSSSNGADQDEPPESPKIQAAATLLKKYYQIVSYDDLTKKSTPPEIDRSVLEMYLSDDEFIKHLGVTKQEWEVMPLWKRTEKKKTSNLF